MLDSVLLTIGLFLAFINIYVASKEFLEEKKHKLDSANLSLIIALSATSLTFIYIKIKSVGPIAIFISILAALLIFLISMIIIRDEHENNLGKRPSTQ